MAKEPRVAWHYQPGAQAHFLSCPIFESLIEGNRGGGKTDVLLMDFAQHVGPQLVGGPQAGFGDAWRGILFRRTYPELEDVIKKSLHWFPRMFPGARFIGGSRPSWRFKTGESLLFRPLRTEQDYSKYHGHEYPWIGFEELTNWPMPTVYLMMFSCCRSSSGCPLKIRSTTNPSGVGHNWVKKRFRPNVIPGRIIGETIHILGEKPRVSIHSDLRENLALLSTNPDYQMQILMAARSEAQRRAWRDGDWNIMAGGMFDDLWNPAVHIVPSFPIRAMPRGWKINRSYDHGTSKPFSVGWWAESNGEHFTWNGRILGSVPGDIFRIHEWYGSKNHDNEGLRLTARQIADGIVDREQDYGMWGLVRPGPADDMIFNSDPGTKSVISEFRHIGIDFTKSNKKRVQGWDLMRQRLHGALVPVSGYREDPGMFLCDRCNDSIEQLPSLPRCSKNEDDVDTESQDHIGDEMRYRVMQNAIGNTSGSWR